VLISADTDFAAMLAAASPEAFGDLAQATVAAPAGRTSQFDSRQPRCDSGPARSGQRHCFEEAPAAQPNTTDIARRQNLKGVRIKLGQGDLVQR
jgi:hypothetical protein